MRSLLLIVLAASALPSLHAQEDPRVRVLETNLRGEGTEDGPWTLGERMAHYGVPGVSIALLRDGEVAWAKGYGLRQSGGEDPVDTETVFSVGSVSKVGAAALTLRLVDAGAFDLDANVNDYLEAWTVPENRFNEDVPVTLRHILSHTGGLTVHGFQDFQPGEELPTTVDILLGRRPAKNPTVLVHFEPGSQFRYSGGGITIEQLLAEEFLGVDYPTAAARMVFEPLGMSRSTYQNPLPAEHGNIACAHDGEGNARALPRGWEAMPEAAASGLWTTPSDFARLMRALMDSYHGRADEPFLSRELARDMMTPVAPSAYGLGPELDDALGADNRRFQHGGSNDSYKAWMEGHLGTGNGLVVFTNGAQGQPLIREIRRAALIAEGW